jgi:acetyl esterase/lipase
VVSTACTRAPRAAEVPAPAAGPAPSAARAPTARPTTTPLARTYKTAAGAPLAAHVFRPSDRIAGRPDAAIVVFHGGGWHVGQPEWMFDAAQRFAARGLVAVVVQYRLADPERRSSTPLDAMADARDAIRWVRAHASEFGADPARVAAYGASAGGHLAAAAALIGDSAAGGGAGLAAAAPDAMVLLSPAVAVAGDGWFRRLVGGPVAAEAASPDAHVRAGARLPPTLILAGAQDSITPPGGARRYCDRVRAAGGRCELQVYPGLGHLLTRALAFRAQESGPFDPDPAAVADAEARTDRFLADLGYSRAPATFRASGATTP